MKKTETKLIYKSILYRLFYFFTACERSLGGNGASSNLRSYLVDWIPGRARVEPGMTEDV